LKNGLGYAVEKGGNGTFIYYSVRKGPGINEEKKTKSIHISLFFFFNDSDFGKFIVYNGNSKCFT